MNEDTQEIFEAHTYEEIRIHTEGGGLVRSVFEKTVLWVLVGTVFFLPVFFLPFQGFTSGFSKNLLLSASVTVSAMLMLLSWLQKGSLVLPRGPIFGALGLIVVFSSFSSLMSSSFSASFFGEGAETTTSFEFLLLGFILFFFTVFFQNRDRVFSVFAALFFSTIAVFIFQFLHLLLPQLTAFAGFLPEKTANLIGSWSDFGIFAAVIAILSLISLEMMPRINTRLRNTLFVFLFASFFFHTLATYTYSWATLALVCFILSVFIFFRRMKREDTQIRIVSAPLITAVISVAFIFIAPSVNEKLFELLHIPPTQDVRPSWTGTYKTAVGVLTPVGKQTLIGIGPNRFFIAWQQYRPKEVNYTPWWSADFNEGVGTIPSSLVTSGILGFAAWVAFLLLFLVGGFFTLKKRIDGMAPFVQYLAVSSFSAASYLWIVAFTNTVGVVPFSLAFIFTGIFLGLLAQEEMNTVFEYNYLQNPRKGFLIVTILLVVLGVTAVCGYKMIEKAQSVFVYRTALFAASRGDADVSEAGFLKAIRLREHDAYYRSLSVFNSYQIQQLMMREDISPDDLRTQFTLRFQASVESANRAIAFDGANYLNWMALGNAYAVLAPLGIEGLSGESYTQAKMAYETAMKKNPFNPELPSMLAELALAGGHPDEAGNFIRKSLELKNDYADALVLLSQVEENQGSAAQALAVIENANTDFSDPKILFRLGYLRYKNGKYREAVSALEKTTQAVPDYSNAKYFLGLSYFEIGRTDKAIKEFRDIERLNSGRSDITQIIRNLQNGYAPLSIPAPDKAPALIDVSTTTKKPDFSAN